jgi:hypothetical protein
VLPAHACRSRQSLFLLPLRAQPLHEPLCALWASICCGCSGHPSRSFRVTARAWALFQKPPRAAAVACMPACSRQRCSPYSHLPEASRAMLRTQRRLVALVAMQLPSACSRQTPQQPQPLLRVISRCRRPPPVHDVWQVQDEWRSADRWMFHAPLFHARKATVRIFCAPLLCCRDALHRVALRAAQQWLWCALSVPLRSSGCGVHFPCLRIFRLQPSPAAAVGVLIVLCSISPRTRPLDAATGVLVIGVLAVCCQGLLPSTRPCLQTQAAGCAHGLHTQPWVSQAGIAGSLQHNRSCPMCGQ